MRILSYKTIENILNEKVIGNYKSDLILKLSKYPNRYVGIFRPINPKAKIIQNLAQSRGIKYGNACELLIRKYFEEHDYKTLNLKPTLEGKKLEYDQLFKHKNKIVFIEQKIRDDHDSSKRRGQFSNFESKIDQIIKDYIKGNNSHKLTCYFYFMDDTLTKSKTFYNGKIKDLNMKLASLTSININLCYGEELFGPNNEDLVGVWPEMTEYLEKWNSSLKDLPEINFDSSVCNTIYSLKDIKPKVFLNILRNENVVRKIFPIIFPGDISLNKLLEEFESKRQSNKIYVDLCVELRELIESRK